VPYRFGAGFGVQGERNCKPLDSEHQLEGAGHQVVGRKKRPLA